MILFQKNQIIFKLEVLKNVRKPRIKKKILQTLFKPFFFYS